MQALDFNKIYVIESLGAKLGDSLTGTELYNSVIKHFPLTHGQVNTQLISVNTRGELFSALDLIESECFRLAVKPIIHFELHGLRDLSGMGLNNGYVTWEDLYPKLSTINEASKWSLFITMAVCFGNYAMSLIKAQKPSPYKAVVGSFDSLYVWDLEIRYNAFYQELRNSLDLDQSMDALRTSNPGLDADYRLIDAEQTFKNVYQKYFDSKFSPSGLQARADELVELAATDRGKVFQDNLEREVFRENAINLLLGTKQTFFRQHRDRFFMFDKFPENRKMYCVDWEPEDKYASD
jgi:hypothetical protein